MENMSKLKSTILIIIMLASVLAGCTSTDTSDLDQQIVDLQQSNDNLTAELESSNENIALMSSITLDLQEALSDANISLSELNIQLSDKEVVMISLTLQRDTLQNDLDAAIESNSSMISSLESQLEILNLEISLLSSDISELNIQLESEQVVISDLTNSLNALSDSVTKLTYQLFTDTQGCSINNPTPKMKIGFDDGSGPGSADDGILQGSEVSMIFGACSEETGQVANIGSSSNPGITKMVEMGDNLYFTADDGIHGNELWKTDGTVGGTSMVVDLSPPMCSTCQNMDSDIVELVAGDSKLFFSSTVQSAGVPDFVRELFVSDGTASGTQLVMDIFDCPLSSGEITFNYEGVNSLLVLPGSSFGTAGQDRVVFSAFHCSLTNYVCFGEEPWISDGTLAGTREMANIRIGDTPMNTQDGQGVLIDDVGSQPRSFFQSGDKVYFTADDNNSGRELWKIDTSRASSGATLVKDINSGSDDSIDLETVTEFVKMNENIFFTADNGNNGIELWKTNGFGLGTTMVKDINSGFNNSNPTELTLVDNVLYFTAYDSTTAATELFQSDGTNMGTIILNSAISNPEWLTAVENTLFFSAHNDLTGVNCLWNSDGTSSGTGFVDITVNPQQIISSDDLIYFTHGNQLLSHDGITSIVDSGPAIENLVLLDDVLFYTHNNYLYYHSSNHGEFITI
jgi:ELWxxDGT repeat protein|tara:strand:+ start:340 stop:2394 length:2055 start_codon:yes stop_codon:yes gene_type:complete